jgi:hypothetical protein
MDIGETPLPKELTPQETATILRRILAGVEKDRHTRWVEITCAVMLSLATISTAWCAYQSTLWNGVQTFRLAAANRAGRDSSAATLAALQVRAFDGSMFINYMEAKHEGNERHEKFLFDRFRPEMKKAIDAWLKTDPFNNSAAPLSPFKMAEYAQPELEQSKRQDEQFNQAYAAAQHANGTSDTYVLLTVLFASVLFFGGIAGTLDSRRLRVIILAIALAFFVVTLAYLATMPLSSE